MLSQITLLLPSSLYISLAFWEIRRSLLMMCPSKARRIQASNAAYVNCWSLKGRKSQVLHCCVLSISWPRQYEQKPSWGPEKSELGVLNPVTMSDVGQDGQISDYASLTGTECFQNFQFRADTRSAVSAGSRTWNQQLELRHIFCFRVLNPPCWE